MRIAATLTHQWRNSGCNRTGTARFFTVACLGTSLLVLGAFADLSCAAEAALPPTIASVDDLLQTAEEWVVAIEVEREKNSDHKPSELLKQLGQDEAKAYFQRPAGPVTGLLVDDEGHVLTSYYNVFGKITSLRVLASGTEYEAHLVAHSERDDLALLKMETKPNGPPLPKAHPPWAEKSALRAGKMVFALGRAPDPTHCTVTHGIMSAVTRNGGRAVQTDADLNYGNSGGPLIDLNGQVVGIACFIGHNRPQWGVNSGVGFGTTATTIQKILPQLRSGKNVKPPLLGVFWDQRGQAKSPGPVIAQIVEKSAAERAGLLKGDVIIKFDGEKIETFPQLRKLVLSSNGGQKIRLRVIRQGEEKDIDVTLGVRE